MAGCVTQTLWAEAAIRSPRATGATNRRKIEMAAKFQIYADTSSNYRWRLKDGNGVIIASSGESFASRSNARRAAENVKTTAPSAVVEDA